MQSCWNQNCPDGIMNSHSHESDVKKNFQIGGDIQGQSESRSCVSLGRCERSGRSSDGLPEHQCHEAANETRLEGALCALEQTLWHCTLFYSHQFLNMSLEPREHLVVVCCSHHIKRRQKTEYHPGRVRNEGSDQSPNPSGLSTTSGENRSLLQGCCSSNWL